MNSPKSDISRTVRYKGNRVDIGGTGSSRRIGGETT